METKDLQKQPNEIINKIDNKVNCNHNINNTFLHLIEEIGKLSNILNKPNIRNKEINIETAILDKINKLKQRHNLK